LAFAAKITYKILTPGYVGKTVDCIANSFAHDPFSLASNLEPRDWAVMSGMFVERAAVKDLSIIAINEETNMVEGIMLNEDWKERKPEQYYQLGEKWRPVRAVFAKVHTMYKSEHPKYIEKNSILHPLYFSCVRPSSRRLGVMKKLWKKSLTLASDYHFETMVASSSSTSGSNVCRSLGFREISSVPYKSFMYEGKNIFYTLPDIDSEFEKLSVFERPIATNLVF